MNCSKPADRLRFLRLCGALCNQTISEAEFAQLEQALSNDESSRRIYIDYLQLHHCTAEWARGSVFDAVPLPATAITRRQSGSSWLALPRSWFARHIRSPRLLLGVVSVVLVGYFLGMMALIPLARWAEYARLAKKSSRTEFAQRDSAVGHVTSSTGAPLTNPPTTPADVVLAGRQYAMEKGEVEVELPGGVQVRLRGPASWQVLAHDRLSLTRGTLVATVPSEGVGFTVVTPSTEVIDLGTEFAVSVDQGGTTDVQVMQGRVELRPIDLAALDSANYELSAGDAVRVIGDRGPVTRIAYHENPLTRGVAVAQNADALKETRESPRSIPLGNLFDDPAGTPIHAAIESDTFRATAEIDDLGVERVLYGGDAVKRINRHVEFDLTNLGWEQGSWGNVTNDTWTDYDHPTDEVGKGGIRTQGKKMSEVEPRIEDGIGSHANALITFDLEEIRRAAGWKDRPLRFVCDRAGINDDSAASGGSVNQAVIVSEAEQVRSVTVNGKTAEVAESKGRWSLAEVASEPVGANGKFTSFDVIIPSTARYLTLVTSSAGNGTGADHAVWSGARLESSQP